MYWKIWWAEKEFSLNIHICSRRNGKVGTRLGGIDDGESRSDNLEDDIPDKQDNDLVI